MSRLPHAPLQARGLPAQIALSRMRQLSFVWADGSTELRVQLSEQPGRKDSTMVCILTAFFNATNLCILPTEQTNSVASVPELTIPTELSPLVGQANANFCG
jgi:hypothetical protein